MMLPVRVLLYCMTVSYVHMKFQKATIQTKGYGSKDRESLARFLRKFPRNKKERKEVK